MWLFEKRGFTSVVAYDARFDRNLKSRFRHIAPNPGTHLLVRARVKEDIEVLREVCPTLVIETDESADYSFRAVITRGKFKQYLTNVVDGIDYDSHFKEEASRESEGTTYKDRHDAMMDVWSAMAKLQPTAPYSGITRRGYRSFGPTSASIFGPGWGEDWGDDFFDDDPLRDAPDIEDVEVVEVEDEGELPDWLFKDAEPEDREMLEDILRQQTD